MARRYFCNISDCIKLMLPPGTSTKVLENRIKDKTLNFVYLKKDIIDGMKKAAECFGVDGIIIPKNRSVEINATVLKTSVGTANSFPICQVTNINDTILKLKEHGFSCSDFNMMNTDSVIYKESPQNAEKLFGI